MLLVVLVVVAVTGLLWWRAGRPGPGWWRWSWTDMAFGAMALGWYPMARPELLMTPPVTTVLDLANAQVAGVAVHDGVMVLDCLVVSPDSGGRVPMTFWVALPGGLSGVPSRVQELVDGVGVVHISVERDRGVVRIRVGADEVFELQTAEPDWKQRKVS